MIGCWKCTILFPWVRSTSQSVQLPAWDQPPPVSCTALDAIDVPYPPLPVSCTTLNPLDIPAPPMSWIARTTDDSGPTLRCIQCDIDNLGPFPTREAAMVMLIGGVLWMPDLLAGINYDTNKLFEALDPQWVHIEGVQCVKAIAKAINSCSSGKELLPRFAMKTDASKTYGLRSLKGELFCRSLLVFICGGKVE